LGDATIDYNWQVI